MDDRRTDTYFCCDNCPCVVNECYRYSKSGNNLSYYMVLCKKCKTLIQGDLESFPISIVTHVMRVMPSDEERKKNVEMAIKERDRCREARAINKKREEQRGKCLIIDFND